MQCLAPVRIRTIRLWGLCLLLSPVTAALAMDARLATAPPTYGTAEHGLPSSPPFLGESAFEVDAISQFPLLVQNQASYAVSMVASNLSNQNATVAGWIDFNGNGMFDSSEAAFATVAAGARQQAVMLNWENLAGVSGDFVGQTYSRLRITTSAIGSDMATGAVADGEVEDNTLFVQPDADGNGLPDNTDLIDSDLDGFVNNQDLDSDNDSIPDSIEGTVDTDSDGVPDYLDVDSDNDGISDVRESGFGFDSAGSLDSNDDGRADPWVAMGNNGLADPVETEPDNGLLNYQALDTDGDGIRDSLDTDSDNDRLSDVLETGGVDVDNNGVVDVLTDSDRDGIVDSVDASVLGGSDLDGDGIVDTADVDVVGGPDTDMDGIADAFDPDANGDGYADALANTLGGSASLPDTNQNATPDFLEAQQPADDGTDGGPVDDPVEPGPIETGLKGSSGCTISPVSSIRSIDPALPLLVLVSLVWLGCRRRVAVILSKK